MQEENREELDIFDLGLTADLQMMKLAPVDRRRFFEDGPSRHGRAPDRL